MAELTKEQEDKANEIYNSFSKKNYSAKDKENVLNNEDEIMDKMESSSLSSYLGDVKVFFKMLKDSVSGNYKLPVATIAAIVGTLLYVFSPIDIIPDFLPVVGLLDDAAVLGACVAAFKSDIDKYKNE